MMILLPGLAGERKEKDLRMLIEFDILDHIPVGHDNAVTRRELMDQTGIKDRAIRDMIHYARRKIAILNLQDGKGYFIPDMNLPEERIMLVQYIQQEESRLKSIGWALKAARKMARNCNVEVEYELEQERKRRGERACESA